MLKSFGLAFLLTKGFETSEIEVGTGNIVKRKRLSFEAPPRDLIHAGRDRLAIRSEPFGPPVPNTLTIIDCGDLPDQ